jgi:endogenous inhibitor of DNA gyrase (YacG/DUF329 family)
MIKVNCPTCGVRLTAPDELQNKPVNCQKCNTKFILSRRWTNEPLFVVGEVQTSEATESERSAVEGLQQEVRPADPAAAMEAAGLLSSDFGAESSGEVSSRPSFDFTLSAGSLDTNSGNGLGDSPSGLRSPVLADPAAKRPVVTPTQSPQAVTDSSEFPFHRPSNENRATAELRHFCEAASVWQFFDFRFRGYLAPGIIRVSWFLILMVFAFWLVFMSYFYLSSVIQRKDLVLPTMRNQSTFEADIANVNVLVVPRFFYNSAIYFTCTIIGFVSLLWTRVIFETVMMVFCIGSHLRSKKNRES